MTRLIFPDEGSRLVYRSGPTVFTAAPNTAVTVYGNVAATVLADLRTYDGTPNPGAPIAGSVLTTDAYSRLPLFWGPDGIDTVYAVISGGPVTPVYARTDDRLDSIFADVRPVISIDYTTKGTGVAPAVDDNGNASFIRYSASTGNPPKLVSGKLVADPTSNSGTYATYWQVAEPNGLNFSRVGIEFTVAVNDGGVTAAALVLWDHDFNVGVTMVPASRAHLVIVPGTGTWIFSLCDGNNHLIQVASGNFVKQAFDDTARWIVDCYVDEDRNVVEILLPDDTVVTVTAAQIASAIAATPGWTGGGTLLGLSGKFAAVEHFCSANSLINVAAFPKFTAMFAERIAPRTRRFISAALVAKIVQATKTIVAPVVALFAPTNGYIGVPSSFTDINTTGAAVTLTVPTGYSAVEVCVNGYLNIGSTTRVLWAVREGGNVLGALSVVESSSSKGSVYQTFKLTGVTPGTHTYVIQHLAVGAGAVLNLDLPNGYVMSIKATPLVS